MERVDLLSDGDLVLAIADRLEIRVSSVVLKMTSPVFKAMLGPRFAEGQGAFDSNNPRLIALPDDNPDIMKLICAIMHQQTDKVPEQLAPTKLLDFARAVDKYDCIKAVKHAAAFFLFQQIDHVSLESMAHCLEAAYLLDDAQAFARWSAKIVSEGHAKTAQLTPEWQRQQNEVRLKLAATLALRQEDLQQLLSNRINAVVEDLGPFFTFAVICNACLMDAAMCIRSLSLSGLWPGKAYRGSLKNTKAILQSGKVTTVPPNNIGHNSSCQYLRAIPSYARGVESLKLFVEQTSQAICLDCLKAGGKYDGKCRIQHK